MPNSLLRFLGAVKEGVEAAGEIGDARRAGLCVNCKQRPTAIIPATATSEATRALLCEVCGEEAAAVSSNVLGQVVKGSLEIGLAVMFTGRRK